MEHGPTIINGIPDIYWICQPQQMNQDSLLWLHINNDPIYHRGLGICSLEKMHCPQDLQTPLSAPTGAPWITAGLSVTLFIPDSQIKFP